MHFLRTQVNRAGTTCMLALLLACSSYAQQGSNGSISGTVTDPTAQAVPGAKVKVVSELNGEEKSTLTNEVGDFFFPAMAPGSYIVRVEAQGFRPLEQKGNVLAASARMVIPRLQLEIGSVSESVLVTAQSAQVATTTTAQAATIDSKQMELIIVKGRDPMSVFKTIPGVTVIADQDTWGGSFQSTVPTFQGRGGNTVYTDGVNGGDGGGGGNFSGITVDRRDRRSERAGELLLGRIRLQGRRADQHGDEARRARTSTARALYYKRHEQFNAQNFFNNRTGLAKPRYRYDDYSGTIGGPIPVRIPVLNRDKKSFNFFYSVEHMSLKDVNQLRQYTMPTALEREGNFSQTRTGGSPTGALVTVRDPSTNSPFPGNVIPTSRRDPLGIALMNIFPLPNVSAVGYNYLTQEASIDHPRRAQLMRFDIRPTEKDTISIKYQNWFTKSVGWEVAGRSSPWGLVRQRYDFTADQGKLDWTRIWTPHLVMEASAGIFYSTEVGPPENDLALASLQKAYDRDAALGDCAPPKAVSGERDFETGRRAFRAAPDRAGQQPARADSASVARHAAEQQPGGPGHRLRRPLADRWRGYRRCRSRELHLHARRAHLQGGHHARRRAFRPGALGHLRGPVRFFERLQRSVRTRVSRWPICTRAT